MSPALLAQGATSALGFEPYPHQREAHHSRKRFSCLVWHRRSGKTVFAILELILGALGCERERGHYAYVAPYLKQGKAVAWGYLKDYAHRLGGQVKVNESELSVTFANGAKVRIYGADNPDSLRGLYFDGIVMDEVADMRPQTWGEVILPALLDRGGWAIFIGTVKGVNLLSEVYHSALEDPKWYADLRTVLETGVIPEEEIERARKEMTEAQFAQEMMCDFGAAVEDVLIAPNQVRDAMRRTVAQKIYENHPKIMGVDVARYGDDRSVICFRQGVVVFKPLIVTNTDLMTFSGLVARAIDKWGPVAVFVDAGGMGAGVVDRLTVGLNHAVVPVDFGGKALDERFQNRRAEMWWHMAQWIEGGLDPLRWTPC
ncbi:MAG: terminase family protein [Deltaproteobacteria bacterium]|nr:terminase family protein [Deltaproteobacteria bacterium]